jgi:hypothetical protein
MKKFNLFVEEVIQNVTEARIPNRNKFYKVDLDAAKNYVASLSDDSAKKTSFAKMLNYIESKNEPLSLDSLRKSLKNILLNDLSLNSAQSMAMDFINDLNARDAFERVSVESSAPQVNYSEDIAQEILKQLQDGPQTKEEMYNDLSVKFPAFLEGGSDKHEADFSMALSNLLREKEIEKVGEEYQILSSGEEDFSETGDVELEEIPEIEEIDEIDDEDPEELKNIRLDSEED